MIRKKPSLEDRQDALIAAATKVFTDKGFRQTQMSDIARDMGVSVGSLYNWVDSKETLFAWTLATAFDLSVDRQAALDPVTFIQASMARADTDDWTPKLDDALGNPPGDDFQWEISAIVGELYDFNLRFGSGIRLIESSTVDFPELHALYFEQLRKNFLSKIERYLADRRDHGLLAATEDLGIMTRSLIELIAWWAIHRRGDQGGDAYDEALVRDEIVGFAVRALTAKG